MNIKNKKLNKLDKLFIFLSFGYFCKMTVLTFLLYYIKYCNNIIYLILFHICYKIFFFYYIFSIMN